MPENGEDMDKDGPVEGDRSSETEDEEVVEGADPPEGDLWQSAVSYDAQSLSKVLRSTLEDLEFTFTRKQTDKMYHRVYVLFPMPKSAYVFRFEIEEPEHLWIDLYDTKPSHSGIIPYMDIRGLTQQNVDTVKTILRALVKRLPRPPWKFTFIQRFKHGLLLPEWRRAKKAWRGLGFDV